jgi:hypothetical protein
VSAALRPMVGIDVQVVDMSQFEADFTEEIRDYLRNEGRPDHDPMGVYARLRFGPWGLMTCRRGTVVLVCSEGVGYDVHPETGGNVFLHSQYKGADRSLLPEWKAPVGLDYLLAQVTGEVVDLAHFVRRFGVRLDNNVRNLEARSRLG